MLPQPAFVAPAMLQKLLLAPANQWGNEQVSEAQVIQRLRGEADGGRVAPPRGRQVRTAEGAAQHAEDQGTGCWLAVSDIALKRELPPEAGNDLMAYVGCVAGAILIEDYRRWLAEAGFSHVEVINTGADLNAYAKIESDSGCCSPATAPAGGLPVVADAGCCGPATPAVGGGLHARLADLLRRYDVNDYAASVRVFAVKPG